MSLAKVANTEPIPGYRLVEPLGTGGFGEVWKCEAPGGLFKAIKFVFGNSHSLDEGSAPADEELLAVERIKAIRHPFILSLDRVEVIDGELVMVMEFADKSLHDLLQECQTAGRPGISRAHALAYLGEAAEALDVMNVQHHLLHLDIKPRNLFLIGNHVKVGDFGLVNSLAGKEPGKTLSIQLGAISPQYASPEIFRGAVSRHSDQYSLAIVYQELITGSLPFKGKNIRQLLLQHAREEPDLAALPAEDRAAVARALAKDPEERFSSCTDFVRALSAASSTPGTATSAAMIRTRKRKRKRADRDLFADPISISTATLSRTGKRKGRGRLREPLIPASKKRGERNEALAPALGERGKGALCPEGRGTSDTDITPLEDAVPALRELLPGYHFRECLGRNPLIEVWRVSTPGGQERFAKVIFGFTGRVDGGSAEAIEQLKNLNYPSLLPFEIVHSDSDRFVLLTDPLENCLRDRFLEHHSLGLDGIPRKELLRLLRTAAEGLDHLFRQHALQHLCLNPRHLLLDRGRLLIADFGLAQLLWLPADQPLMQLNARYAAPELFEHKISPACDQFSVASIYQEMLTGTHPWHVQNSGSRTAVGVPARLNLSPLPSPDRGIVARALDHDPRKRWQSIGAFVSALESATSASGNKGIFTAGNLGTAVPLSRWSAVPMDRGMIPGSPDDIIGEFLAAAGRSLPGSERGSREDMPEKESYQRRFGLNLSTSAIRIRLDAFRQQWNGQVVRDEEGLFVFHVKRPRSFWQRCAGRQDGLEVRVHLTRSTELPTATAELTVRPLGYAGPEGVLLLRETGALVLESAANYLQTAPERRTQERLLWEQPFQVQFIYPNRKLSEVIACQGKDISLTGIGLYLPAELPSSQVRVCLPHSLHDSTVAVTANVVRVQRHGDRWYEVGARFAHEDSAHPELV